jgi:hypothetical protein
MRPAAVLQERGVLLYHAERLLLLVPLLWLSVDCQPWQHHQQAHGLVVVLLLLLLLLLLLFVLLLVQEQVPPQQQLP